MGSTHQHPSAPVIFDPPPTAESIAAARAAADQERAEYLAAMARYVPPTEEEMERLEAQNGLAELIRRYGSVRVHRWIRNLADILEPDRPTDCCLADGAALINKICVRCGRDNS